MLLKNELRRAFINRGFPVVILLVFLLYFQDGIETLSSGKTDVFLVYHMISELGSMRWLIPCVGAICFAGSYVADVKAGFLRYYLLRSNQLRYVSIKVFACFLSAALATMIGITAFLLFAFIKCRVLVDVSALEGYVDYKESLSSLISSGRYVLYLAFRVTFHGLAAGMWAVFGLMLSGIWQNTYITIFSPALFAYFKGFVYDMIGFRPRYYLTNFEWAWLGISGVLRPVLIIFSVFIGLSILFGIAFGLMLRRRIRND